MNTVDGWEIANPLTDWEKQALARAKGLGYYLMAIEEIIEKWGSLLSEQELTAIKMCANTA